MVRKQIFVLGVALALFAASEATAQAPADSQRQSEVRRGDRARGGERARKMRRAGMRGMFRGIELTQAQRDQMQAIHAKYRPQLETIRESMKPDLTAAREARQRGDTVAARAAFERTAATRERAKALHEQQRNEIRALLTPEQRTTFDANAQRMKERMEKRGEGRRGGRQSRR
ncbi:MAG: Spy/CpxP family protein refolding chaperone [Gemmatimonadaceae bacterium]